MMEQRYKAKLEFFATNPISARKRRVIPGEIFFAELLQHGPVITIKLDESEWLVDRDDFERSCVAYGISG